MSQEEFNPEDLLGVWAEDPRSVAGVRAMGKDYLNEVLNSERAGTRTTSGFIESASDDPRVVATRAAIRDARLPDRLLMPGGYSGKSMVEGEIFCAR